jgi:hypothetical protein
VVPQTAVEDADEAVGQGAEGLVVGVAAFAVGAVVGRAPGERDRAAKACG